MTKKKKPLILFFEIVLVGILMACFVGTTFVQRIYFPSKDIIHIKACLPWLAVFALFVFTYMDCFTFGERRFHELLYSSWVSVIIVNILMLTLPFFTVLYQMDYLMILLNIVLQLFFVFIWLFVSVKLYLKINPPMSCIIIQKNIKDKEIKNKIERYSNKYRVSGVYHYKNESIMDLMLVSDIVVFGDLPAKERDAFAKFCIEHQKYVLLRPNILDIAMANSRIEQFEDLALIKAKPFGLTIEQRFIKRLFDIVVSGIGLIFALPIMIIASILIFLTDGASPFYMQKRITVGNREFNIYKLRTMKVNAESATGPTLAVKDDDRITWIGKILRSTRIDELPQLINVFLGDMSIVGPRPERQFFIDKNCETVPEFKYRTSVKAGLTGFSHISGRYSTRPEEKIITDLIYIQNYSFIWDIKIIIETVRVVFTKGKAE